MYTNVCDPGAMSKVKAKKKRTEGALAEEEAGAAAAAGEPGPAEVSPSLVGMGFGAASFALIPLCCRVQESGDGVFDFAQLGLDDRLLKVSGAAIL